MKIKTALLAAILPLAGCVQYVPVSSGTVTTPVVVGGVPPIINYPQPIYGGAIPFQGGGYGCGYGYGGYGGGGFGWNNGNTTINNTYNRTVSNSGNVGSGARVFTGGYGMGMGGGTYGGFRR
jgi:hypothetical protein